MGVLGVSLIFVAIALIVNGVGRLCKFDAKSSAAINLITGLVIVGANFIGLARAQGDGDYVNIASGFLFGFTYLFIAANNIFGLDLRPFGWFSLFVAVYAGFMAVLAFAGLGPYTATDWRFGALWSAWAILWLSGFVEIVCKVNLNKVFPFLSIAEGVFAAALPAIVMLCGWW